MSNGTNAISCAKWETNFLVKIIISKILEQVAQACGVADQNKRSRWSGLDQLDFTDNGAPVKRRMLDARHLKKERRYALLDWQKVSKGWG